MVGEAVNGGSSSLAGKEREDEGEGEGGGQDGGRPPRRQQLGMHRVCCRVWEERTSAMQRCRLRVDGCLLRGQRRVD